jgi:pyruvate/2-oxoglutarate dehydrogenase complex dihydrolipoamide acyltransferase (E2) component
MKVAVEMPRYASDAIDGRISAWQVEVGTQVQRGDVIVVIETDKAELDLEAMVSGVLVEIVHGAGNEVPVGEAIAYIETDASA